MNWFSMWYIRNANQHSHRTKDISNIILLLLQTVSVCYCDTDKDYAY